MDRKNLSRVVALVFVTFAVGSIGYGQAVYDPPVSPYSYYGSGAYGYSPYGYHSSTAGEGYARGMADVIRSYGENNLANARAQREWEAARKAFIENRVRATQVFYERREIYNQYRAAKQYEERARASAWLAKIRLEDLTSQEFNMETGQIAWPKLLADEQYLQFRSQLDLLFAKRAQYGELDVEDYARVEALLKQWRMVLTERREAIPDLLLRDGLRFLLRLNRELEHNYG